MDIVLKCDTLYPAYVLRHTMYYMGYVPTLSLALPETWQVRAHNLSALWFIGCGNAFVYDLMHL